MRRKVMTSSALVAASKLRGFEVIPTEINFGVLQEGSMYKLTLTLKNIGLDLAHFKIKQPPPSTGIKVIYNPGAVSLYQANEGSGCTSKIVLIVVFYLRCLLV